MTIKIKKINNLFRFLLKVFSETYYLAGPTSSNKLMMDVCVGAKTMHSVPHAVCHERVLKLRVDTLDYLLRIIVSKTQGIFEHARATVHSV